MDGELLNREISDIEFERLLSMLNSKDKENGVVALTIIDNIGSINFNDNITQLLILKKAGEASLQDWRDHAPKVTNMLQEVVSDLASTLSWKSIIEIIVKRKVNSDKIKFALIQFMKQVGYEINSMGYSEIDSIEINIKLKTPDGEQSVTTKDIDTVEQQT